MKAIEDKKVVAGVDVASEELVVRISTDLVEVRRVENDEKSIRQLVEFLIKEGVSLVVCEHTGRYELALMQALWKEKVAVHCAHPKAVHNFAKALKANAKSDPIDACVLMEYGLRMDVLPTSEPAQELSALRELTERRRDFNEMLVKEKNRLTAPGSSAAIRQSIKAHIVYIQKALKNLEQEMRKLVDQTPTLKAPIQCLDNEHGVAFISAATIYASMPELGTLSRQSAAALAGLAPFIKSSGKFSGQRKISGGRKTARCALYMVALTSIRSKKTPLRDFYLRLKKQGKPSAVAITAVMRKIIIRLNTKMKELLAQQQINTVLA